MVRSYLIENRIRFNSDSGSGGGGNDEPDRSNPAEMAGREKSFIDRKKHPQRINNFRKC